MSAIYANAGNGYEWVQKIKSPNKILLCGSSSVRYGLGCSELNTLSGGKYQFVNVAMDARGPIETYYLLKSIGLKGINSVYLGLDPWIYTKRYYKHRYRYLYLDFSFIQTVFYCKEHDSTAFVKRYKALLHCMQFRLFDQCPKKNNKPAVSIIPKDYGSVDLIKTPINFNEYDMKQLYQLETYGWSQLQFTYLEKIYRLCKQHNVAFTVFFPPKRFDYFQAYQRDCASTHAAFLANLEKSIPGIPILGRFDQLSGFTQESSLFKEAYHLNALGQDLYSFVFYKMITRGNDAVEQLTDSDIPTKLAVAAPGTAKLIVPSGSCSNPISFSWMPVLGATWYYLWVADINGEKIKHWYHAEQCGCANTKNVCEVTPGVRLANGPAAWWIQAWNDAGYGEWSSKCVFSVESKE